MQVETLHDVLHWTQQYHHQLADCMKQYSQLQTDPRAEMLLGYLSDHEEKLANVVRGFENTGNANALNTWCLEYLDKSPIFKSFNCDPQFAQMNTAEIISSVEDRHNELIGLYRYLHGKVDIPEAEELLGQLLDLEQHEAMRMAQSANRLEDL